MRVKVCVGIRKTKWQFVFLCTRIPVVSFSLLMCVDTLVCIRL